MILVIYDLSILLSVSYNLFYILSLIRKENIIFVTAMMKDE